LNKSEALLAVEPLHGSLRHKTLSSGCASNQGRAEAQPMKSQIWEKFVGLTQSAQAKSFGRTRFALGSVFLACFARRIHSHEARGDKSGTASFPLSSVIARSRQDRLICLT
jgi:hypothetical protein